MGLGILNRAKQALNVGANNAAGFTAGNWDIYSPATLLTADFIKTSKTLTVNNESLIGENVIEPQTEKGFGFGTPALPYNQGVLFMDLKDSAEEK